VGAAVTGGGLRRFAQPAGANGAGADRAGADRAGADRAEADRGGADRAGADRAGARCELCGADLGERHGHVVALDDRSLRCACRPCYLLFTPAAAGGGRLRAVPERYLTDPDRPLADADWDALQVPVSTAFFFRNTDLGRVVACYPSPAGATECLLDLAGWQRLTESYPLLAAPAPDVEAVFVSLVRNRPAAFLIPIDAAYRLVGAVRLRWRGIAGGDEVRRTLEAFVDDLTLRSGRL
jgi:Family of unknown function (DUF5947)